jgi:hypothetical protein
MSNETKRTFQIINNEYNQLCAIVGDFFIKQIMDNPDMIKKYKEFQKLKKEVGEIKKEQEEQVEND